VCVTSMCLAERRFCDGLECLCADASGEGGRHYPKPVAQEEPGYLNTYLPQHFWQERSKVMVSCEIFL